jgi:arabinose-5-phosphate isomerase
MTEIDPILTAGRRVIQREAEGLSVLAETIGPSFSQAAQMILAAQGRVILSGMCKSGHVARKIAATFASTGTPAYFVHPAEASHGDLGMLADGDVVLLFSNSGETPELADIITYTRRFAIPMIGICGRENSTLMQSADLGILLPQTPEACERGIVPTTSTTMTLALGDALAIALMEHREFTAERFRDFHPGGKLGAQLARVRDLMHVGDALPLVQSGTEMSEALLTMTQKGFGVVGVVSEGTMLKGVVTDGDLRRHMTGLLNLMADDVMTVAPKTIAPDALAAEALAMMTEHSPRVTCLFVVDPAESQKAVGILHIHDCLRAGIE